jgi:hypothetical protein
MKTSIKNLLFIALAAVMVNACDDDNNTIEPLEATLVTDLPAVSTNRFVFYSLRTNSVVTDSASMNWDIGMRAPAQGIPVFIFNGSPSGPGQGGAMIVDGILDEYAEAPATGYSAAAVNNGWYTYTGTSAPQHAVIPTAGKIFVLKTADGKYAKLQMISGYQGNPDTSTPAFADVRTRALFGYFTFRFVVQPDGSRKF